MKNLYVIYRISDKGNPKKRLTNGGKIPCLENAIKNFGAEKIHVIADNCEPATIEMLRGYGLEVEPTANGNSGTCRHIFNNVINRYNADDNLYLLEDDYLHLPGSREAILEGLEIADYVTLYDHPDMYFSDGKGPNPFVHGEFPKCSMYLTKHTHWRTTISTTMTFAASVRTLQEDKALWLRFLQTRLPQDFPAWVALTGQNDLDEARYFVKKSGGKVQGLAAFALNLTLENFLVNRRKRLLISAVPSMSTHTDCDAIAPLVDWEKVL